MTMLHNSYLEKNFFTSRIKSMQDNFPSKPTMQLNYDQITDQQLKQLTRFE